MGEIQVGRLTCVEAVQRCLARVSATESEVRAFVHLDAEGALEKASELDRNRKLGLRSGPLEGVCVAVKDMVDVGGMPTSAGSRVPDRRVAESDADIVSHLRNAGAIVIGKVNTHEFANGVTTPPTRNPVDLGRIAGGSSGGSAAAVATGAALLGVGTDTGGSVRLPAALCGVAGLRPRTGSIGMRGIVPLAPEFDAWGLVAPSAADLNLVWQAIGSAGRTEPPKPVRLIFPKNLSTLMPELDQEVAHAFRTAKSVAPKLGAPLADAEIPDLREWRPLRMAIQMRQALRVHRDAGWWPQRRHLYTEEVRMNFQRAEENDHLPLNGVEARLSILDAEIDGLLADGSVLCLPTVPVVAPRLEDILRTPRNQDTRHPVVGLLSAFTLPFSRGNLASITICVGMTDSSMPVGLQFVANSEAAVLHVGASMEAELELLKMSLSPTFSCGSLTEK